MKNNVRHDLQLVLHGSRRIRVFEVCRIIAENETKLPKSRKNIGKTDKGRNVVRRFKLDCKECVEHAGNQYRTKATSINTGL